MKNMKTEGKAVAFTTRQVKARKRPEDATKPAKVITTKDVRVKK
jgi:hypothetical protein